MILVMLITVLTSTIINTGAIMSVSRVFIHDLRNDLLLIRTLVMKLNIQNEHINKINKIIESVGKKCSDALTPENAKEVLINVNQILGELILRYTDVKFDMNFEENLEAVVNKNKFEDVINNIIKNSQEAGATIVKFQTKFKSLIITDDANCSIENVDKLNNSIIFSTKTTGHGIGSQSIKQFCETHGCRLLYSKIANDKSNKNKFSLIIRIKFP